MRAAVQEAAAAGIYVSEHYPDHRYPARPQYSPSMNCSPAPRQIYPRFALEATLRHRRRRSSATHARLT